MAEVDEFAVPSGITLKDCMPELDTHIASVFNEGLKAKKSRLELVDHVYNKLGHAPLRANGKWNVDAEIELWIAKTLSDATPGKPGKKYCADPKKTKYHKCLIRGEDHLAPIVNCGGIIMGSDKIGHFFQIGYRIFNRRYAKRAPMIGRQIRERHYIRGDNQVKRGGALNWAAGNAEKADGAWDGFWADEESAWKNFNQAAYNHQLEAKSFGISTTGVYSAADIAANDAGAQFYLNVYNMVCGAQSLRRYVSKNWNEGVNSNKYASGVGSKVWANILTVRDWKVRVTDFAMNDQWSDTFSFKQQGGQFVGTATGSRAPSTTITLSFKPRSDKFQHITGIDVTGRWVRGSDKGDFRASSQTERALNGQWTPSGVPAPMGNVFFEAV